MYMKNFTSILLVSFLFTLSCFAQVGIGTTSPESALHVAGATSTIRIDGLNSVNHPKNLGGTTNSKVVVNADGDLSLGTPSGEILSEPIMPSAISLKTTAAAGLNSNELYSKEFTLTERALVVITYYVSMDFKSFDGTSNIDDGRAKVAHNYFYLGNGTTADASKSYGMTSSVYSNWNCDTATGFVYNSRSTTILLEAGNYSIHLNGAVYGGNLTPDAAFSVSFGDTDRLDISAIYL